LVAIERPRLSAQRLLLELKRVSLSVGGKFQFLGNCPLAAS
jgi:hypothetical protein